MMRRAILTAILLTFFAACLVAQQPSLGELKAKASTGEVNAQLELAKRYEKGDGISQNDDLAFKWYLAAAEQGNAEAEYSVGFMYRMGHGVDQDKAKSVEWYRKAAAQGHASARFNLGVAYYNGDGVPINDERSLAWFMLAQQAGEPRAEEAIARARSEHPVAWVNMALVKLGEMFDDGEDVPTNPVVAAAAYQNAIVVSSNELVQQEANIRLAKLYLAGRGVPKDVGKARNHLIVAAKVHSQSAYQMLGSMYETDAFGAPDYKEAAHWYGEAAHFGDFLCMYRLGRLYEAGSGVKQDRAEAFKLYVLAMRKGQTDAQKAAEKLYPDLTDKEFRSAQKKLSDAGISIKRK